jgi:hypothetical protein
MEKKLFRMFDRQKFEANKDLQQIIDTVHARYDARELTLDDMEWVNAAGEPTPPVMNEEKDR